MYKPSGVSWLGDVPAHWEVRRLKYLLWEQDIRSVDGREQLLRVSQYTGVTQRNLGTEGERAESRAESLVGYKCVDPNDLVVNIMLAWNGSMGVSQFSGIASPAYCVYRFKMDAAPRYFHYLLRSPKYGARIKAISTGVVESRLRLYTDYLYSLEGLLPPLPEQTAIVRFLDHADRRIRRYIRAKRKLIALLEEQKQAIIHEAVTGRTDVRTGQPYPAYKPSGVEWLGEVPEHWEVKRLKWVTRLQRGYDLPSDQRVSGPYPVVSSGGVIDMHSEARSDGPGVVMGRYGSTDAVFFIEPDFWPHNTALFVTNFQGNRPRWCYYMLRAISKADHAGKSAVPGVDRKDLFEIKVAVPHIEVQDTIIEKLEEILIGLEAAFARTRSQINLFREYQTRLIADVVTGKIDVRGAAAALPEVDPLEAEEGLDNAIDADAEEATHELAAVLEEAEA